MLAVTRLASLRPDLEEMRTGLPNRREPRKKELLLLTDPIVGLTDGLDAPEEGVLSIYACPVRSWICQMHRPGLKAVYDGRHDR